MVNILPVMNDTNLQCQVATTVNPELKPIGGQPTKLKFKSLTFIIMP